MHKTVKNPVLLDLTLSNPYDTFCYCLGGVAQLARAFEWHSKGQGFDSPYLQKKVVA